MAKIVYDSDKIQSDILDNLTSAASNIRTAKNYFDNLDVPEFTYSNYIRELPVTLIECMNKCNEDNEYIKSASVSFSRTFDETGSEISKTEVYNVKIKDINVNSVQ